jgi:hypothetical protein
VGLLGKGVFGYLVVFVSPSAFRILIGVDFSSYFGNGGLGSFLIFAALH